ncbi:MAG: hypothetical protein ACOY58_07160, partial [Candidatus Micrarchaeota archaeon]
MSIHLFTTSYYKVVIDYKVIGKVAMTYFAFDDTKKYKMGRENSCCGEHPKGIYMFTCINKNG